MELANASSIEKYWPDIAAMMRKVPHTLEGYTPESLFQMAMDSRVQLWLVGKDQITLAMITQVASFPTGTVLEVFWGAGVKSLDSEYVVDATLDSFARACSCVRINVIGRPGWEPLMKAHGFKKQAVVFSRDVRPERVQ